MRETVSQLHQAIGVMDSGVGGISVLKHVHALLPHEHLLYFADSRYAPYGAKSAQVITQRCFEVADFLVDQGVKAIVVACNTATAAAISQMRARYKLPIIGMEPAVKPAAAASKSGIIGILATNGTLQSAQFAALLEHYGQQVTVVTQACVGLVECIERGAIADTETRDLIARYLTPLLAAGADTIVLGCTHYPFVRPLIEDLAGRDVVIIDTGGAVAKQLQSVLLTHQLAASATQRATIRFYSNSMVANASNIINALWGTTAVVQMVA